MDEPESLQSELLTREGFRHGFFTRRGGVSSEPWATLNTSVSTGDSAASVERNLERIAGALDIPRRSLYVVSQVHGSRALITEGSVPSSEFARLEADAIASSQSQVACAVRTADCVPILVGDARSGAVAAIHAGWRGVVAGVVASGVDTLRGLLVREPELCVAVGPHIESCCFEVDGPVANEIARSSTTPRELVVRADASERPRVDLRRVVTAQLEALGVAPSRIDHVRGCTVCDVERFFSYRRDKERSGRLLSAIVAR